MLQDVDGSGFLDTPAGEKSLAQLIKRRDGGTRVASLEAYAVQLPPAVGLQIRLLDSWQPIAAWPRIAVLAQKLVDLGQTLRSIIAECT